MRNNLISPARATSRLRHIPIFKLIAFAEIAVLARDDLYRLEPRERQRLIHLVQVSRGRSGNLSQSEPNELADLLGKMEPRLFAGKAAASCRRSRCPSGSRTGRSGPSPDRQAAYDAPMRRVVATLACAGVLLGLAAPARHRAVALRRVAGLRVPDPGQPRGSRSRPTGRCTRARTTRATATGAPPQPSKIFA